VLRTPHQNVRGVSQSRHSSAISRIGQNIMSQPPHLLILKHFNNVIMQHEFHDNPFDQKHHFGK
jgi:hypothetical protein